MNQILSTSMPMDNKRKNRSGQPIAIGSILKFFGIAIIVFGVFLIGIGAYTIYKNQIRNQSK